MLVYAAKLKLIKDFSKEMFIEAFEKCSGTIGNRLTFPKQIHQMPYHQEDLKQDLSFDLVELPEEHVIAGRSSYVNDTGVRISVDSAFNTVSNELTVIVNKETTEKITRMSSKVETPRLVKHLIKNNLVEAEQGLKPTDKPIILTRDNYQLIADVINQNQRYALPVVYLTKTLEEYEYPINPYDLASMLQGTAYVFAEGDPLITDRLKKETNRQNPFDGYLSIYYPSKTAKPRKIDPFFYPSEADAKYRIQTYITSYMLRQTYSDLETYEGVMNTYLVRKNKYLSERHHAISLENEDLYQEYGTKLENYEAQIEKLKNRVAALEQELGGVRAKHENKEQIPLLFYGDEPELYEGEIREMILDALATYAKNLPESRRNDVIQSILRCNTFNHDVEKRCQEIKRILKGYSSMSSSIRSDLEQFGFVVEEGSKHHKLVYYGDPRYFTTIAATGSDHRIGSNNASEIIQYLL